MDATLLNHSLEIRFAFALTSVAIVFSAIKVVEFVHAKISAFLTQRREAGSGNGGAYTIATATR